MEPPNDNEMAAHISARKASDQTLDISREEEDRDSEASFLQRSSRPPAARAREIPWEM
jgi:hypothetical protein